MVGIVTGKEDEQKLPIPLLLLHRPVFEPLVCALTQIIGSQDTLEFIQTIKTMRDNGVGSRVDFCRQQALDFLCGITSAQTLVEAVSAY
jgi:hypothetical protein